ncbi:helicase associated domain-containing protein [Streptomyces vinaceus]|uniref:helicase associated domain-containing protein n=1 Tax=Streptomyces vinaceus TaxID=1960 RepID=UPI0037F5ABA4
MFNTERQDWRRGVEAAFRYREREGDIQVPYEHTEGPYPLGRWLSDQRRAFRAGTMSRERAAELEELGIVWDTADHAFEQSLAAARAYHQLHGTLAAPRGAAILDIQIGQWLTNIRRPDGLGKDPVRAGRRAAALAEVDADWNPAERGWTVDWQRQYAYLTQLLAEGTRPTAIVPGVTRHGEDIGRWLATQRRDWARLNAEQQARLTALGVTPARAVRARQAPAKTSTANHVRAGRSSLPARCPGPRAERRAGRQRTTRPPAHRTPPRDGPPHREYGSPTKNNATTDSTPRNRGHSPNSTSSGRGQLCEIPRSRDPATRSRGPARTPRTPGRCTLRVGIWCANQKQRRNRLNPGQLAALAELGVDWA